MFETTIFQTRVTHAERNGYEHSVYSSDKSDTLLLRATALHRAVNEVLGENIPENLVKSMYDYMKLYYTKVAGDVILCLSRKEDNLDFWDVILLDNISEFETDSDPLGDVIIGLLWSDNQPTIFFADYYYESSRYYCTFEEIDISKEVENLKNKEKDDLIRMILQYKHNMFCD